MRRTASVLGSALVTLALAASPAWAGTPAQSTKDSTLAAQVGPVDVDAPVRIASDGDNRGAAQAKGGSQGIDDSTGAAQVGPVEANAPVRVLSDGENQAGAQRGSGGKQSTTDSDLVRWCTTRLPDYGVPRRIKVLDQIPQKETLKSDV